MPAYIAGGHLLHSGITLNNTQYQNKMVEYQTWLTYVTAFESGPWGVMGTFAECIGRKGQQRLGLGSSPSPSQCPDVGGIPLLIHIILPSQHQCP